MKILFSLAVLCGATAAHAQLLPVPGAKNPDWKLEKSEAPQAERLLPPTDRMPNAAQKSVLSTGNQHAYWDADRQLAYQWQSGPGSVKPEKQVKVLEQRTGIAYVYRRRQL
ncbi:MAG: hypothetical protein M3Y54_12840 [Bacteroidota bacterium]|nr:hypothetical protein [Bacteroidota bacterium]